MIKLVKKIWINKNYFAKIATCSTNIIFTVFGFINLFISFDSIIPDDLNIFLRILIAFLILTTIWILSFLIFAFVFVRKKMHKLFEVNKHKVYVQYGDLFSEDELEEDDKRRIIIVPVNRCFDTIIDDDLVSSKTLHGIAMNKIYSKQIYDQCTLNNEIQKDLIIRQYKKFEEISIFEKRKGNLKRFSVGSVAEIDDKEGCKYFFLALSMFGRDLTAHTDQQDYVLAMQRLIEYCNNRSQQYPVVMPLIGAGLSRTEKSERIILEYIVKLLKMNKNKITNDIHIVIRDSGNEVIKISDL